MLVFFCGGSPRLKFYQQAFPYKHKKISWLRPNRIIESDAITDLQETMTTPIRRKDYDRLPTLETQIEKEASTDGQ